MFTGEVRAFGSVTLAALFAARLRIPGDVNGAFRKNVNKDSEDVNRDSDGK